MADVKISGLPASTVPLTGAEVLPIVQSAVTKQVSIANVQAAPVAAGLANAVQYLNGTKVPSTSANMSFNGTNFLLGTTTSVVRATVSGTDSTPPTLGTAAGTAFFCNTSPAYGLLIGTSTGGWSWMQSQRVSGAATAYDLMLQPTSGGVNIGDTTSGIGAGNLRLATGNLIIGTSGKGIDFSATPGTGTSELLNDYEEGTWTPNLLVGATGSSGTYTKIGRQVTVRGLLTGASISFGATTIICDNLPFNAASGANFAGGVIADANGAFVRANSQYVIATTALTPGVTAVTFTVTYFV